MNQNIKDRWVAALRSGRYKQTRNVLTNGAGYCCLGVLCELAIEDGEDVDREVDRVFPEAITFNGNRHYLPVKVQEWAGLDNSVGRRVDEITLVGSSGRIYDNLSAANDSGASFEEIADMIEEHWEKL